MRIYSLDYLRGVAALGIMFYHYTSWVLGGYSADDIMLRIGVYGVSVFYVLSGLTLFHIYHIDMKPTLVEILIFFKKRFLSIFPLLWLVTIVAILISGKKPDLIALILNLTGLFGFVSWDVTFSIGVWSIGNELVFYSFFPLFIYMLKINKQLFWLFGLVIFFIFLYFAYSKIYIGMPAYQEKRNYFNPFNNLFLFYGGIIIGELFCNVKISSFMLLIIFFLGICLFLFYPAVGKRVDLLTGSNRIIFTLSCFLLCLAFYKLTYMFPNLIHQALIILGESSYSIYLLHPLVFTTANLYLSGIILSKVNIMTISFIGTLTLSYFTYNYFEKFFMRIRKRIRINL